MAVNEALGTHLSTGVTTVARAWAISREDGVQMGFTDHDCALEFEGIRFEASGGMTASALQQSTGLSVDNAEATGVLSHDSLSEGDIEAGRFDGAEVRIWYVNWADVSARQLLFRGYIGEIRRSGQRFEAELRGLAERLNQTRGQVYQGPCPAILGDARCGVDVSGAGFGVDAEIAEVEDARVLRFAGLDGFEAGWFERGHVALLSGSGTGLNGLVKRDVMVGDLREVELWQSIGAEIAPGDQVRLVAGCDKRAETCRLKFSNLVNFRGFPHIPGEDWLMSYPKAGGRNDGASLVDFRNTKVFS